MLEFLFSGLSAIIAEAMAWTIDAFTSTFAFDLELFKAIFKEADTMFGVLRGMGWALAGILIIVTAINSIVRPDPSNSENMIWVIPKLGCVGLLIYNSESVMNLMVSFGRAGYNQLLSKTDYRFGEAVKQALGVMEKDDALVALPTPGVLSIISLVFWIVLGWQLIKLFLECIERYVTFCTGAFLSPIIYPLFVSKLTSSYGSGYISFMAGQGALMWVNAWSLSMIKDGFRSLGDVEVVANGEPVGWFVRFLVIISFILVAQKMDNVLQQFGFKNIRGGSTMMAAAAAAGAITTTVVRSVTMSRKMGGKAGAGGAVDGKATPADPNKQTQGVTAFRGADGKMRATTTSGNPATREQISKQMSGLEGKKAQALENQSKTLASAARSESFSAQRGVSSRVTEANQAAATKATQAADGYAQQVGMYDKQISNLNEAMQNAPDKLGDSVAVHGGSEYMSGGRENAVSADISGPSPADNASAGSVTYNQPSGGSTVTQNTTSVSGDSTTTVSSPVSSYGGADSSTVNQSVSQSVNQSQTVSSSDHSSATYTEAPQSQGSSVGVNYANNAPTPATASPAPQTAAPVQSTPHVASTPQQATSAPHTPQTTPAPTPTPSSSPAAVKTSPTPTQAPAAPQRTSAPQTNSSPSTKPTPQVRDKRSVGGTPSSTSKKPFGGGGTKR